MLEEYITCPHCNKKIQLTEAFTHDIEDRLKKEFESEAKRKEKEFEEKFSREKASVENRAKKEAEESVSVKLNSMMAELEKKSKQLKEAQEKELDFLNRQKDLEDRERTLKLELERKLSEERNKIWDEASSKVKEEYTLKDREKDLQLTEMRKQIEELKRKAEQGSQQTQGEALELELEEILNSTFRIDNIEPVAKGVKGADLIQKVNNSAGQNCGVILWETKRTKSWNDNWIDKLKNDQREAKAEIAVIVSSVLPKHINRFGNIDGVWVTDFQSVVGLASALRVNLVQLFQARNSLVGRNEKMEIIYKYLSGVEFKQRVEAIVESFVSMKEDLESEKRAMERVWAKRGKQIERVIKNTAGMYGDLQGIVGASLPQIKMLELPAGEENL